jgi:glycosyltransferase involved in cell wall biosynthesis
MNLAFCVWLHGNRRRKPWVMFHEVAHPIQPGQRASHRILALVNRMMASLAGRSAARVLVTIPAWIPLLKQLGVDPGIIECLPVPSCVATEASPDLVSEVRQRYLPDGHGHLVGHFGTYAPVVAPMLEQIIPPVLEQQPRCTVLLIGRKSREFADQVCRRWPAIGQRVRSAENLTGSEVAAHLAACDCLVQPFPDGASGRRTSLMAGLALGLPIVTTSGFLTEPTLWEEAKAVEMVAATEPGAAVTRIGLLLSDPVRRSELGERAQRLYAERFSLEHTLSVLLGSAGEGLSLPAFDGGRSISLPAGSSP